MKFPTFLAYMVTCTLFPAVILLLFVVVRNLFGDTIEKRIRVTGELRVFRDRLQNNPTDREALTNLMVALDDSYRWKRIQAAGFLGDVGPVAKDAVPALANALKKNEGFLRCEAALALSKLGPDARSAIPELIEATKTGNGTLAWNAVKALGNMETDAETVVPALAKCLEGVGDPQPEGGTVGPELAIQARFALGKIAPYAQEALIPLRSELYTLNGRSRLSLATAIRIIDPADTESLQVLTGLVYDEDMNIAALTALGDLATTAKAAIPAIETYLRKR
jgi:HEAT repeat protein